MSMRTLCVIAALAGLLAAAPACVEPFEGSHMQFALERVGTPCQMLLANAASFSEEVKDCRDSTGGTLFEEEQRFKYHYEMWATVNNSAAVFLFSFTVQKHLFPKEQKAMERAGVLLSSGKPLIMGSGHGYYDTTKSPSMSATDRKNADEQMIKAEAKYAITSYSKSTYVDEKASPKTLHPEFYLGNHGQLTLPHNGVYYGQVASTHPYGIVTLSGATVSVAPNLENLDSLWITIDKAPHNRADPSPNNKLVLLRGTATRTVRGVVNVEARVTRNFEAGSVDARALFGVFAGMGEEEYF